MSVIDYIVLGVILTALVFAVRAAVKKGGRCSGCSCGDCSACAGGCARNDNR